MVALLEIVPVGIRWFCETIEVEVAIAPKPVERQLIALCLQCFLAKLAGLQNVFSHLMQIRVDKCVLWLGGGGV